MHKPLTIDQVMTTILTALPDTPTHALLDIAEALDPIPLEMRELSDTELLEKLGGL